MILIILFGIVGAFVFFMSGVLLEDKNLKSVIGLILLGFLCLFGMYVYSTLREREYYQKNYPEIVSKEYNKHKILELEKRINTLKEQEQ